MLDRFARSIAVSFMRQHHKTGSATMTAHSLVHAFRLNRKCSGVVIVLAVNEKHRLIQLVGEHEGRHFQVRVGRLPQRSFLILKSEGRERPVVCATASDPSLKKI
jgi:hypothetical protein